MPCRTHLTLYYDLEGKLTGEYDIDCAGDCSKGGQCRKVVRREDNGQKLRIFCACVNPANPDAGDAERDHCDMELVATRDPQGKVELTPVCCPKPCKDRKCEECQMVSYGKSVTVLDPDSDHPRVRQQEEFRCECQRVDSAKVQDFYRGRLCQLLGFAARHGIQISAKDLFHAHVVTDAGPPCRDQNGDWVMSESFMMDHYRGLVAHAHEYDGQRSETEDNFNLALDADGTPHFAGSTTTVYAGGMNVPAGPWPDTIYFRLCAPGVDCPECTVKIHCDSINADLCVGLRRRWPANDPALGKP